MIWLACLVGTVVSAIVLASVLTMMVMRPGQYYVRWWRIAAVVLFAVGCGYGVMG